MTAKLVHAETYRGYRLRIRYTELYVGSIDGITLVFNTTLSATIKSLKQRVDLKIKEKSSTAASNKD